RPVRSTAERERHRPAGRVRVVDVHLDGGLIALGLEVLVGFAGVLTRVQEQVGRAHRQRRARAVDDDGGDRRLLRGAHGVPERVRRVDRDGVRAVGDTGEVYVGGEIAVGDGRGDPGRLNVAAGLLEADGDRLPVQT